MPFHNREIRAFGEAKPVPKKPSLRSPPAIALAQARRAGLRLINLSTMINQLKGKTLCDNRKVLIEGQE